MNFIYMRINIIYSIAIKVIVIIESHKIEPYQKIFTHIK
jgi:hypothetical protein